MDINRQSMLVDMLMKVPADAVLWVEHETGGPVGVKIGPLCRNAAAALSTVRPGALETGMHRFTAYRRNISLRDTHNELQKNPDDEPQFEGVVFSDGRVAIRWLTACGSTSIWDNLEDCLNIHGHPEYGTEIIWHDGDAPKVWLDKL